MLQYNPSYIPVLVSNIYAMFTSNYESYVPDVIFELTFSSGLRHTTGMDLSFDILR